MAPFSHLDQCPVHTCHIYASRVRINDHRDIDAELIGNPEPLDCTKGSPRGQYAGRWDRTGYIGRLHW